MVKERDNGLKLNSDNNYIEELKEDIIDFIQFFNNLGIVSRGQISSNELYDYKVYLIDKGLNKDVIARKINRLEYIFLN